MDAAAGLFRDRSSDAGVLDVTLDGRAAAGSAPSAGEKRRAFSPGLMGEAADPEDKKAPRAPADGGGKDAAAEAEEAESGAPQQSLASHAAAQTRGDVRTHGCSLARAVLLGRDGSGTFDESELFVVCKRVKIFEAFAFDGCVPQSALGGTPQDGPPLARPAACPPTRSAASSGRRA